MLRIRKKYKYELPKISLTNFNLYIKEAAKMAGIPITEEDELFADDLCREFDLSYSEITILARDLRYGSKYSKKPV